MNYTRKKLIADIVKGYVLSHLPRKRKKRLKNRIDISGLKKLKMHQLFMMTQAIGRMNRKNQNVIRIHTIESGFGKAKNLEPIPTDHIIFVSR